MIEIMVVIAAAALLTALSVPGLKDTLERNAREAAMMDLMSAIGRARSEAVAQGRWVTLCRSTDQATCAASSGGDWSDGWIIFSDTGTAGTLDGTDALVQVHSPLPKQSVIRVLTLANGNFTGDYIRFDDDGFLKNSTTGAYFRLCSIDKVVSKARAVWLANTGRPTLGTRGAGNSTSNYKDLAGADLACP